MTASRAEPVTTQPSPRHDRTARWPWYLLRTVVTALSVYVFLQSVFAGLFLSGDYPQLLLHRTNAIVVAAIAVVLVVAQYLLGLVEHSVPVLLLPGEPPKPGVGDHPWVLAGSLVADLTAAERELGYRPITTYRDAATETVAWLRDHVAHTNWQQHLTHMASLKHFFDYEAEDTFLRLLAR